ncbi:cysteine desulfurase family protein [Lacipirellula parvula]|uniref:cysteine desulfurase n=1 Tax=Lacipirellula parvula TaxID=2650471 RepID=A0A5K7X857_9BACT|nr:cysteine desulfurase family protein [Lacipirellula parvula]BBO32974.1 cysteine desulfurase [Lacipirellula parvula]
MPASVPIYMDNHATTRVDPRVVEAMFPYFTEQYGNAGSIGHAFGEAAREAVEQSRTVIASAIGAEPEEIVFTSGATESNNLAIRGVAERPKRRGDHLVSVQTEHKAVLDPLARLARRGYDVTLLEVEPHGSSRAGWLDRQRVADVLRDDTALVSVMLANNEIGVLQPIAEIAAICRERGVTFHCDATQAVGKLPVDVRTLGVDLMSFTAHKMYGPKGIGALYVRRTRPAVRLEAQITGGGQQDGLRSGTLNVAGIVGFAAALQLCTLELPAEIERLAKLRDRLWQLLRSRIDGAELCGPNLTGQAATGGPLRLPGNLDVAFGNVDGEALLLAMGNLAVSSGAACSSTDPSPSHVLLALGLTEDLARSTLRFGLGRFNTIAEVEAAAETVAAAVARLRELR